mgnify:CR=1 FL=1
MVVGIGDVEVVFGEGDALGVLELALAADAVAVAVFEEAGAGEGDDVALAADWDGADGGAFGVDPVELDPVGGDAGGLGEGGEGAAGAVVDAFAGGSGEDFDGSGGEVHLPELVDAGHGNVEAPVGFDEPPRGGEVDVAGWLWAGWEAGELAAGAGDGADLAGGEVDGAYSVVSGIGNVEGGVVVGEGEPLGVAEGGFGWRAVGEAWFAGAEAAEDATGEGGFDDAMVAGVGDVEAVGDGGGGEGGGVGEGGGDGGALGGDGEGVLAEKAAGGEFGEERGDDGLEEGVDAFAFVVADEVAGGVDKDEGGPGAGAVGGPGAEVGVVDDGVGDAEAADGLADGVVFVFFGVFAGVDADDEEVVAEFGLEALEVGHDVLAVDAAGCPEIEEDDAATEVVEGEWALDVEPGEALREGWRGLGAGPGFAAGLFGHVRGSWRSGLAGAGRAGEGERWEEECGGDEP